MKRLILTMIVILFSTLTLWSQTGSFEPSSMPDSTEAKHHHNKQHNKQHGHHPHHHSSISARR
jgi:ABC-type nickel/cobalt efflux system permease component RcnA